MKFPSPKLTKKTTYSTSNESWGMGFFLVLFPQDHHNFKTHTINTFKQHTHNSSHIISKAQYTLSVCALLIFTTLLLFTLASFEPNHKFINKSSDYNYRRHLYESHRNLHLQKHTPALQRLGTLYSRGTTPMNDVVICHVTESVTLLHLKTFLRAFHRSGLFSKSDVVFIFPSFTTPESFDNVIRDETNLFIELTRSISDFNMSFDVTQFSKSGKLEKSEPIWGRKSKISSNSNSNSSSVGETELTRPCYGSVVGFGVGELDPENSLSGFFEYVPMSIRRWASYPMILGRLRRNFKHVILIDVNEVLLLGDPLFILKKQNPETVFLSSMTKHNRKVPVKQIINSSVIIGGARGVRRLSAAMLMEIVRVAIHDNKKKMTRLTHVTESVLLSRIESNEFVQKSIRLVDSGELIHEASLSGVWLVNQTIVRRNSKLDIEFMKYICSFTIEASVYSDCQKVQSL
ncbi:uncharacterized protein [Rutidosis leptorrhynchoides]|uniref:uncharacterized protein n=1 Tax=Rutidosis leptorrhynchoides TaxID=125765 RepID=UPI003A998E0F